MTKEMRPLVSIIIPVYNSERFISLAIDSALAQTFYNIELLIINDGSTDATDRLIEEKRDTRTRYFKQENKGVSAARNVGLANMKGDYFCFLDADDILPPTSIEARLKVFQDHPGLSFVDGAVLFFDDANGNVVREYQPRFQGNPLVELMSLTGSCFACPSWLIKRTDQIYRMREDITHGEDLLFYMELARQGGLYSYTNEIVLQYRKHSTSAMNNLYALEEGYWAIYNSIYSWKQFSWKLKFTYTYKVKKFMFLDYLKCRDFKSALLALLR
jgi:teichuronic acid biosynthesis glycosyltransferase TuaG